MAMRTVSRLVCCKHAPNVATVEKLDRAFARGWRLTFRESDLDEPTIPANESAETTAIPGPEIRV